MRNVENKHRSSGGRAAVALVASLAALLAAGCGSAPRPAPSVAPAPQEEVRSPLPPLAEPAAVGIQAVELEESDGEAQIVVSTDGNPVWTSFRDESGLLVIELPNSAPGTDVGDILSDYGVVESVKVRYQDGERPLTSLRVKTRMDAEHAVVTDGSTLRVELVALESGAPEPGAPEPEALAAEPPAEILAQAVEEVPMAAEAAPPAEAPAPPGPPATQVHDILVSGGNGSAEIRIVGDGEFFYSTFNLEGPDRFVVDLIGVLNTVPGSSFPVQSGAVKQVRVAQFKSEPDRIARVVVDLSSPYVPVVEPFAGGLVLRFDAVAGTPGTTLAEDVAGGAEPAAVPAAEELPLESVAGAVGMGSTENGPAEAMQEPSEEALPEEAAGELPSEMPGEMPADLEAAPAPQAPEAPMEDAAAPPAAAEDEIVEDLFPESEEEAYDWQQAEEEPAPAAAEFAPYEPAPAAAPAADEKLMFDSQAPGVGQKQYFGEPMTMTLKDADIKDVLRSFAQISGLNVVVQPGVEGTVTVELTEVPWDQALEQILKINGLDYELEGNIMRIAPISKLREEAEEEQRKRAAQALSIPLRTVIKRVSYAEANDIARLLQSGGGASLMSQRGSVVVDGRTNTLIIKELPTFMNTVIAVIETLDTPEPQVMIEARIIETTKRFSRTLGISWGLAGVADAAHGNTTGLQFPNNISGAGGVELLTGGSNGFLNIAMGNVLNTFTLDATLQAAESDGLINILSAPRITTLNNERATIQSGLQIPVQTIANNTVSVQFVNATLRLDVTPHVTAEGTVLMDINIQKREPQLAFAVVGATNAPIATKDARTRVIVRDGGTTVIGGIYKVSSDQGEDRVPGLANVPIIKHLFKNKRRTEENEELLIFITPRVVRL